MTVVDSSILIEGLVENTPEGTWCRDIISDGEIHAPELVFVEVINVLRRMERIEEISDLKAHIALDDLLNLPLTMHQFIPFANRIWDLRHNLTPYDAWYVALAESLDSPLITLDRRIARVSGLECQVVTPPV